MDGLASHHLKLKSKKMSKRIYPVVIIITTLLLGTLNAKSAIIGNSEISVLQEEQDPPVTKAPDVTFKNSKGEEVKISELKGKVVFINFWATWCPPCRIEMPTINKLYKEFKDNEDMVFLIVDADNKSDKCSEFTADKSYAFPIYVPAGNIPYVYFSGALPTTVMINKTGEIVFRHAGAADYGDPKMVDFVKSLLEEEV